MVRSLLLPTPLTRLRRGHVWNPSIMSPNLPLFAPTQRQIQPIMARFAREKALLGVVNAVLRSNSQHQSPLILMWSRVIWGEGGSQPNVSSRQVDTGRGRGRGRPGAGESGCVSGCLAATPVYSSKSQMAYLPGSPLLLRAWTASAQVFGGTEGGGGLGAGQAPHSGIVASTRCVFSARCRTSRLSASSRSSSVSSAMRCKR